jgi:hypothetical protein
MCSNAPLKMMQMLRNMWEYLSLCTYKNTFFNWKTTVSKNWIKRLHTLPVLHFSRCLTIEYSETTAHFNGNFDTDDQIYVP